MSEDNQNKDANDWKRTGINLGSFLIALGFVWIVFDNLALALLFALIFAGGAETAQRVTKR